jgi:hypothetical protein
MKVGGMTGRSSRRIRRHAGSVHETPKPMSSYPDVVPPVLEPEAVISRRKETARRAIVSINGKDVDEEILMTREDAA